MKKLYLNILLLFVFSNNLYAQGENNFWYFGNNAGINFSNGSQTIVPTVDYNATGISTSFGGCDSYSGGISIYPDTGGSATVSKADGTLLFYTDGERIYNKLHQQMSGQQPLYPYEGLDSKQSAIIFPNPSNINQFYVISSCARQDNVPVQQWSYYLTVVDFSSNINGQIISTQQQFSGFCEATQAITVTKNYQGDGFWVIIPISTNQLCAPIQNRLIMFKVDSLGLALNPTVVNNLDFNMYYNSEVKVSKSRTSAKICISGSNSVLGSPLQKLRVYGFDRSTGLISNSFLLNVDLLRVFSTEFSSDGNLLYATVRTSLGNNRLVVFDLNNPLSPYRELSGLEVFGSLQCGINGEIYFTNNSDKLYKIDNQNSYSNSIISSNTINLTRCTYFGLPQLVPTFGWPIDAPICPTLTLTTEPNTGLFSYQNYSSIITQTEYNVNLSTQNISLRASDYITLKPNTLIKTGSTFSAKIQSCVLAAKNSNSSDFEEEAINSKVVKLFPNPNEGSFTVLFNKEMKNTNIVIYDIFGKSVFNTVIDGTSLDLNIPNITSGLYLVKIISSELNETIKFIKK